MRVDTPRKPPLVSMALVSLGALAYEILLLRLFSIVQWHHFAYMVISVALLGYGASGSFLAITRRWWRPRFEITYLLSAAGFSLSSIGCYLIAQQLPLNALEWLWDSGQWLWLALVYCLLFIPFFCAANCICLLFTVYPAQLQLVYCFDLIGAACGGLAVIALLYFLMPMDVLKVLAALGILATVIACHEFGRRSPWPAVAGAALAAALALLPLSLEISPFKGLPQAKKVVGAQEVDTRSSPLGLLTTLANPTVPFRHAPGLSLNARGRIPEQLAVFTDGDAISPVNRFGGNRQELEYVHYLAAALPYRFLERPEVLVLGAGGGSDLLTAFYYGARTVDAVEMNSQFYTLMDSLSGYAGASFLSRSVNRHIAEARGFVEAHHRQYDLIVLTLLDSFSSSVAGLYAIGENYLYTTEALQSYYRDLKPGGMVAISRWLKIPPRDSLKLFATALEALRQAGVNDPARQLIMIRSWNTVNLLIRNGPFDQRDIELLKTFCRERSFDLIFYPGMTLPEANRFNRLQQAYFYEGVQALLSDRPRKFIENFKFHIEPATDDQPYFNRYLKLSTLPELLSLKGQGGLPLVDSGYLLLLATLAQALLISLVFITVAWWLGDSRGLGESGHRWRFALYFALVGLGFMFLEIAFIQKFILFLSHPLYSVAVVLASFLFFAGAGSYFSRRWRGRRHLARVVAGIALLSCLYILVLPVLFENLIASAAGLKIALSVTLIAPLAFLLGQPFPTGLSMLAGKQADAIPWSWCINGCASVTGAVLATVLAIHWGFVAVVLLAAACYIVAARVVMSHR